MISLGRRLIGVGIVLAVVAGAAAAVTFRLSQGPLSLPFLAGVVASRLSEPERGYFIGVGDVVLAWTDDAIDGHGRLDIRLQSISVRDRNDIELAAAPEAGLGLSVANLLEGRLRPTRIELIRPRVVMRRQNDGSFGFAIPRGDIPAPAPGPAGGENGGPPADDALATPVAEGLLDALARPPESAPLLGLLHTLAIRDGEMVLSDPAHGIRWRARPATVVLTRGDQGINGLMRLNLSFGDGGEQPSIPVDAQLTYDAGRRNSRLTVSFARLSPVVAAGLMPELAPLRGLDVPLTGSLTGTLSSAFHLTDLAFSLDAASSPLARSLHVEGDGKINSTSQPISIDKMSVRLIADGLQPRQLAGLNPDLEALAGVAFPVSGRGEVMLEGGRKSGRVAFDIGAGTLAAAGIYPEPLTIQSGRLEAEADSGTGKASVSLRDLDLVGPRLSAALSAHQINGKVTLTGDAALTNVPVERLPSLWPAKAAPKPRLWSLTNITAGHIPAITASFAGTAPVDNPFDLEPQRITARIEMTDATIHYFRPLPPVVGMPHAVADFDGRTFIVHTRGGQVVNGDAPPVHATDGVVTIINVGTPREDLSLDINLLGPLNSILGVIDLPPLGYPAKLNIKPAETAGEVTGRLRMAFPLFDALKLDDLQVQVDGHVNKAAIAKVAAGRDATDGDLDVKLDTKGMVITGKARFDGIPITVNWKENFDSTAKGPGTVLEAQGRAEIKQIAGFVPDLTDYGQGPVDVKARYTAETGRSAVLNVNADLNPAKLMLAPLGWSKPPGVAGRARLDLHFKDGKPTRISDLRVEGGGLGLAGTIAFNGAGEASRFDITRFAVGQTDIRAVATRNKNAGYDVRVSGASVDAHAMMDSNKDDPVTVDTAAAEPVGDEARKKIWTVDLILDRLLFGDNRGLSKVTGQLIRENGDWNTVSIHGNTPPRGALTIQRESLRSGVNRLRVVGEDAGNALLALDVTDRVRGGRLTVIGYSASTKPLAPIDGTVDMQDYTVVDAPALARILNAMSITGLAELLSGEGISFGSLTGKFRKAGDLLSLKDLRTSGGALGLTAEGTINLAQDTAHLNGTIVPVYGVNRIIGQIPLLGDLLSGGPGQGIFAATYAIDGKLDDPDVSVNPLALLTPGFLRNLFFGGSSSDNELGMPSSRRPPTPPTDTHSR